MLVDTFTVTSVILCSLSCTIREYHRECCRLACVVCLCGLAKAGCDEGVTLLQETTQPDCKLSLKPRHRVSQMWCTWMLVQTRTWKSCLPLTSSLSRCSSDACPSLIHCSPKRRMMSASARTVARSPSVYSLKALPVLCLRCAAQYRTSSISSSFQYYQGTRQPNKRSK